MYAYIFMYIYGPQNLDFGNILYFKLFSIIPWKFYVFKDVRVFLLKFVLFSSTCDFVLELLMLRASLASSDPIKRQRFSRCALCCPTSCRQALKLSRAGYSSPTMRAFSTMQNTYCVKMFTNRASAMKQELSLVIYINTYIERGLQRITQHICLLNGTAYESPEAHVGNVSNSSSQMASVKRGRVSEFLC